MTDECILDGENDRWNGGTIDECTLYGEDDGLQERGDCWQWVPDVHVHAKRIAADKVST